MTNDDDRILELLRGHYEDREADRDELLRKLTPWIQRDVRQLLTPELRRDYDSLDFVQEVLGKLLARLPTLRPENAQQLRGWLAKIVRHQVIDCVRHEQAARRDHRKRVDFPSSGEHRDQRTGPATSSVRKERIELLQAALEMLTAEDRAVIQLKLIDELTYPQIAERLGVSDDTARQRYYRALPRFREQFDRLRGTGSTITF